MYHWATVAAAPYGRLVGFFAGWWNCFAWLFALVSTTQITAAQTVSMYAVMHPSFTTQRWHVFVSYIISTWTCCFVVLYFNRALPAMYDDFPLGNGTVLIFIWVSGIIGGTSIVVGVFVCIIVCAVMPHVNSASYASTATIWVNWSNHTGYSSDGFVFLLGILNGAFAVGTPDIISHLAEEVPR